MKFGKCLIRVIDLCEPEWGPFWVNYNELKKIVSEMPSNISTVSESELHQSPTEVHFFRFLRKEVKKVSDFYATSSQQLEIRRDRIRTAYTILREDEQMYDEQAWTRLLVSCVRLYKDLMLLENFSIMNYCGFSKILKKHDKFTRTSTRDAFMRKIVCSQNFARYTSVLEMLREAENMFETIRKLHSEKCLMAEELLFIEVLRDLNQRAGKYKQDEKVKNGIKTENSLSTSSSIPNKQSISTSVTLDSNLFELTSSPSPAARLPPMPPSAPQSSTKHVPLQLAWIERVQKDNSALNLKRKAVVLTERHP